MLDERIAKSNMYYVASMNIQPVN